MRADKEADEPLPVRLPDGGSPLLYSECESLMGFFENASDDQVALVGCAVALLLSGGLMYLSYVLGQGRQASESQADTIRLHAPRSENQIGQDRKVA